ncbi:MAG TPA: hypothetical protein VNT20_08200 [Flavisolibacter sp.]|nr:hypothetical protein [Flavisolibacter sp.]
MTTFKLIALIASLFSLSASAQGDPSNKPSQTSAVTTLDKQSSSRRINFYVVNKPKTLDLYSRLVIMRAKHRASTRKEKFIVIVASSSSELKNKVIDHLQKRDAMIGSLWFDSHGKYKNGYSSFVIGNEEFSYKTIRDTSITNNLHALAAYCDEHSRVAIGSCYGGATYEQPAHNGKPASRMNGDSLVIGLANVLPKATIYGTEGWVMTKPGIFARHTYALAGFPLQKRFKDEVYKPVWEHMGIWHSYSTETKTFTTENTLSLTHMGTIHVKSQTYLAIDKYKKRQDRNLKKLKPGLAKI